MEDGAGPSPPMNSAPGGEGFGELYRRHYRPLLGMATAILASRDRAEEVVQEAFATTFDHYRRIDDPVRATRRSVLRGCAAHKPSPVDDTRGTQRILSRVRSLPRAERDAVALRHSLGLDAPEIDHALGLEPGTAALRLHDAGTKLRASLEVGDDLDRTLTTAFAETTAALGHVLARPGEAQRRVYHRRRIRVAAGATALVVVVALAAVLFSRGPSDEDVTTGSDGTEAPAAGGSAASTDAPTSSSVVTTIAGTTAATVTTVAATPAEGTYTVVSGDGWYAIATKLDVSVDSLLQANGATLATPLGVGQVLKVPPKPTT